MARELKVWNGRGDYAELDGRLYVCAMTKKRAVELLMQAGHRGINMNEFTTYYSACWGVAMIGVTREEGVWLSEDSLSTETPKRLI